MPRDPRAYLQRAEEHRRHGRLKEAITLSIEALGKHPGLDAVRVTLGRAYLENGQPEEARATLLEVFGRLPEHHLAGKLLIESQRLLGDLAGAETTCRTLLEHYPRDREIEPILAEITRARSSPVVASAPAAPVASPPPQAPPAPRFVSAREAAVAAAPAVAVRESDPEPEYFPEDIAAAPGAPAPPPPAARAAAAPAVTPVLPTAVPPPAPMAAAVPSAVAAPRPAVAPPPVPLVSTAAPGHVASIPPAPAPAARAAAAPSVPASAFAAPAPVAVIASNPTPLPPAPPVAAPAGSGRRDALETNTLAELYVKQGLPDRAIEVYRSMLRVEPGNAAAQRRLAEIERAAAAPAVEKTTTARRAPSDSAGTARAGTTGARAAAPPPAAAAAASARSVASSEREAIERLEGWLAAVKRGRDREGGGAAA